ncbi:MAG TPA: hypothetical protein VLT33_33310 [Labilithrix sp.]|nr:hypothetical protein [Labilithrix sp.]
MLIAASCGGTTAMSVADAGTGDGATGDASASPDGGDGSTPPLADAPFACGTATCRVDQYCLEPCCGGPAPQCQPATDAGTCPPGTHLGGSCAGRAPDLCQPDPCVPAPPRCVDSVTGDGPIECRPSGSSRILACVCA